jgi:hypothetical protein
MRGSSCHARGKFPPPVSSKVKVAGTEESNQSDDDQIKGDDIVQQPGHGKNENPGDQRYERSKTQMDIHEGILSFQFFFDSVAKATTHAPPPTSS